MATFYFLFPMYSAGIIYHSTFYFYVPCERQLAVLPYSLIYSALPLPFFCIYPSVTAAMHLFCEDDPFLPPTL